MGDVRDWFKRQQKNEIEEYNRKHLDRMGFSPPETPWLVNYRHGADGGIEQTLIADDKFRVKPMSNKQVAALIHHLSGLLASEVDK